MFHEVSLKFIFPLNQNLKVLQNIPTNFMLNSSISIIYVFNNFLDASSWGVKSLQFACLILLICRENRKSFQNN